MQLLQLVVAGLSQGCVYGLIALGFVLVYRATETVSFAQGDLMMLGSFGGLIAMDALGWSYWLAVPVAIIGLAAVGFLLERIIIRPILGQPVFSIVMLTVGIGYGLRGLITMVPQYGTETHKLLTPYSGTVFRLGTLVILITHDPPPALRDGMAWVVFVRRCSRGARSWRQDRSAC